MKLSIIIPAYNEENRIANSLDKILKYVKKYNHEIIVINDGSTDKTLNVLKKFKNKIKIISYSKNKGKGYAVKKGMLAATGDLLFMCDADLSMPISELNKFLKHKEDIVIGSRAIEGADVKTSILKKFAGRIGNFFISVFTVSEIKDTQCGFKLFKAKCKKLFEKQTIDRWGFDFEILFLAKKYGFSIKEIPIRWQNVKGSKVKLIDYPRTLLDLIKIKINDLRGKYE